MIPARAPDIIQNGSFVMAQAPIIPPDIPIKMLKDNADSVIGVP